MTRPIERALRVTGGSGRIDDSVDGATCKTVPPGRADIANPCVQCASDDLRHGTDRTPIVDGDNRMSRG